VHAVEEPTTSTKAATPKRPINLIGDTYDLPKPTFTQPQLRYLAWFSHRRLAGIREERKDERKELEKALEDANNRAAEWQGKCERLEREMAEKENEKDVEKKWEEEGK
jgi:hypothetical protein